MKWIDSLFFWLGYVPKELLDQSRAETERYHNLLVESEKLTQRGLKVITTLRLVNNELAKAVNRASAVAEFEMRVKRASGEITTRTNEAG